MLEKRTNGSNNEDEVSIKKADTGKFFPLDTIFRFFLVDDLLEKRYYDRNRGLLVLNPFTPNGFWSAVLRNF